MTQIGLLEVIPVTKSWGEGDGIEGGLAALNVS